MLDQDTPKRPSSLVWLRNSFAAGVAIVLPFALTAWLIWTFVRFVDGVVAPLLPPEWSARVLALPGFGVAIALTTLLLLGALLGNLAGRFLVGELERLLNRLPIVRSIYGGSKQVFGQLTTRERTSFKEAVLVEFPRPGLWTIGFLTNPEPEDVAGALGPDYVAVYVPQAPIPTTGFIFYAPRAELKPLPIGPEEALKRVLSLGVVKAANLNVVEPPQTT